MDEIQRAVCAHYRLDKSEMASKRRVRAIARPRQVAMYLAKELTPRSYPEIGRRFGGRDHSTVKIGRASCRDRVCQYVSFSVVAVSLKKKRNRYISDGNYIQ